LCREFIKHLGDNASGDVVERMVKICSLLPPSPDLLVSVSPFAEKTKQSISTQTDSNHWTLPWDCMSLALFEYRRGNYAEAINWGNRCLSFKQDSRMERLAGAQAILAMSYHQLGQAEQARSALARSYEQIEDRWKAPLTANQDSRGWWYDWLLARILEGEAAAAIESPAPASKK
jgi:hypothetical protein